MKNKIEQQMDTALEEQDHTVVQSPTPEELEESFEAYQAVIAEEPVTRDRDEEEAEGQMIYEEVDPQEKENKEGLSKKQSSAGFLFEFDSIIGKSTELLSKAVNTWNDLGEEELSITSQEEKVLEDEKDTVMPKAPTTATLYGRDEEMIDVEQASNDSSLSLQSAFEEMGVRVTFYLFEQTKEVIKMEEVDRRRLLRKRDDVDRRDAGVDNVSEKRKVAKQSPKKVSVDSMHKEVNKASPQQEEVSHDTSDALLSKQTGSQEASEIPHLRLLVQEREKQLEAQLHRLVEVETTLDTTEREKIALSKSVTELQAKLRQSRSAEQQVQQLEASVKSLAAARDVAEEKSDALMTEGVELAKKNGDLELKLRRVRSEQQELQRRVKSLEQELGGVQQSYETLKQENQSVGINAKATLKKLTVENERCTEQVKEKELEVGELKAQLSDQILSSKLKTEQQSRLEEQLVTLRMKSQEERVEAKASEARLVKEVKMLKKKLLALEKSSGMQLEGSKRGAACASNDVALLQEVEKYKQRNDEILLQQQREKTKTMQALVEKEQQISDLSRKNHELVLEQKKLRMAMMTLETSAANHVTQVAEVSSEVELLEEANSRLTRDVATLREELRKLTSTLSSERSQYQRKLTTLEKKQTEAITELEQVLQQQEHEIEDLKLHSTHVDQSASHPSSLLPRRASKQSFTETNSVTNASHGSRAESQPPLSQSDILQSLNISGVAPTKKEYYDYSAVRNYQKKGSSSVVSQLHGLHREDDEHLSPMLRVHSLQGTLRQRNGEIGGLKAQLTFLETSERELMQALEAKQEELKEAEQHRAKLQQLTCVIEERDERIRDLEAQVQGSKEAFRSQIESLASEVDRLKHLLSER